MRNRERYNALTCPSDQDERVIGTWGLLLAKIVGPEGEVVSVDSDGTALETARSRAAGQELKNIAFCTCDLHRYKSDGEFDLVFGRCVLIHQTDPVCALPSASKHARPEGIIAFQEPWFSRAFSRLAAPLLKEVIDWIHDTVVEANHLDLDLGARLPSIFVSANLPVSRLT